MPSSKTRRNRSRYSVTDLAEAMERPLARARSFADVLQLIGTGMQHEGSEDAPAVLAVAEMLMDDLDVVQIAWGHLHRAK